MPRTVPNRHLHGGTTLVRRIALLTTSLAVLAIACGGGAAPPTAPSTPTPASIPADALPGRGGDAVILDAEALAKDAVDPAELGSMLERAGFQAGTQRVFSQTEGHRPQRSLARVVTFEDAAGARAYVAWLEANLDQILGSAAELLDPGNVPEAGFLALGEPQCLCPKATDVYLAAWTDGPTVLTLEVGGKGVRAAEVEELVETFAQAVAA